MTEETTEVCPVCQKSAQQKCSACKSVYYCSREHQKRHWKQHAKECKPYKLCEDAVLGRHYIATRKIESGEIIFEEMKPLVAAPQQDTCPLCLECYTVLDATTARPCVHCGWLLCDQCEKHGAECEFTVKHRSAKVSIKDFGVPHPMYKSIGILRALALRESNPDDYQRFINLQSHLSDDEKYLKRLDGFFDTANFIKKFFKLDDIDEKEIAKIAGIFQINGHEVPTTDNPHVAVYDAASYLEHNCRANSSKSFSDNGGIIIRAAVPIAKGDHITVCYTDPLWGVTNRRHHLAQTKFFDCLCERCCDPTEFGTMFNALKCQNGECGGSVLPATFITTSEKSPDYICAKCQDTIPWDKVEMELECIGIELAGMKKNDIEACRRFLKSHSNKLSDNHFYMIDVKLALVQLIGQQDGGLPVIDDEILNEKISICQKLDQLLAILVPAENRIRGLILFELHAGLAEYGRRQGQGQLPGMLMLSRKALAEAYQLLRVEPEILPEGKVARIAHKNLLEMDTIIKTLCQTQVTTM